MAEPIVYEYIFKTHFSDDVYNAGPVQNDAYFLEWIKNSVAAINACDVTSSLINHNGNVYKITVIEKGPIIPLPKVDMPLPPHLAQEQS